MFNSPPFSNDGDSTVDEAKNYNFRICVDINQVWLFTPDMSQAEKIPPPPYTLLSNSGANISLKNENLFLRCLFKWMCSPWKKSEYPVIRNFALRLELALMVMRPSRESWEQKNSLAGSINTT